MSSSVRRGQGAAAAPGISRVYGVKTRRSAPLRLPMHADAPDHGGWEQWVAESDKPIAIDLFCGAGGLSQGLEAAGYRVALSVDIEEWALETHAHNFPGLALKLDLASREVRDSVVSLLDHVDVDLVAGGPPCQPFSRAGRSKIRSLVDLGMRDAVDVRKELWRAFLDLVERIRPRAVLMENVPDMALGDGTVVLRHMIDRLEEAEYEVDARIVDTWLYGVPQHRQRLILVAIRDGGPFTWPDPVDQVSVADAIADLPVLQVEADSAIGKEVMPYRARAASEFARRARSQCTGELARLVHDHLTRAVRDDDLDAFMLMTPGTLYSELPDRVKRYRDDIFDDKYNRLAWDGLSRSITAHIAKDGYWYIHPQQHRTLTVREAARIQTFPDSFRFAGTRSHQFQQIGNAVPPALGEVIATAVLDAIGTDPVAGHRPSRFRGEFRTQLGEWAVQDRSVAPWAYPGEAWAVAVAVILGANRGEPGWPSAADVLHEAPDLDSATPELFGRLWTGAGPGRQRRAVERLAAAAAAVRDDPAGWEGVAWSRAAALGPAGRDWFGTLTGADPQVIASTAALRVTARVSGSDVDRQNRNSAGRMELAKLVGGGEAAALLNAAIHRLGTVVCTSEDAACQACPVRELCSTCAP
jgi:DNA (cytosine-5)-methyltransferase 1